MKTQIIQKSYHLGRIAGIVLCGYRGSWWCLSAAAFGFIQIQVGGCRGRCCFSLGIGKRWFGETFNQIET